MGYLGNGPATRDTFAFDGGWLRTGDLGSVDADGLVRIHDRLKEMIKVKGVAVAPAELEDCLLGHDRVADVAVVGIPDDYCGEVPKAFVVLKDGDGDGDGNDEEAIGHELERHVREKKARFKWVKGGFEVVEEIPKSASGKILRKALKDNVQA